MKEHSKTIIKARGWGEAIDAMNPIPRTYPNKPSAAPQYPAPMPDSWNQNDHPHSGYTGHRSFTEYEDILLDKSAPSQAPPPRPRAREHVHAGQRGRPIVPSPPIDIDLRKKVGTRTTRPEVRFTLPRARSTSSTTDTTKGTQPSPAKPDDPPVKTGDELQTARQRLEQLKKRKEEAENSKDVPTATATALPAYPLEDLVSRNEEYKGSRFIEVETESESSGSEGGSGV